MKHLLLVCLGGGIGSGLRYGTTLALGHFWPKAAKGFPLATLLVNLVGCFAIGLSVGLLTRQGVRWADEWNSLLLVGVCGGLTTFSTFALQTLEVSPIKGALNVGISVAAGLLLAFAGLAIAR